MIVIRGNIHKYLGTTLDFPIPGKVKIYMTEYIDSIFLELPPEFNGEAAAPVANHLFIVNEDAEN
eukprot:6339001-Ditylum_brightwellii.AAC.2